MFNRAWLAGGIPRTACVAAYEPICAVSLADSYINRANPGTYTVGVEVGTPTWAASTGWGFSGTTQGLSIAGLTVSDNFSAIVRYSGATNSASEKLIFGSYNGTPSFGARFGVGSSIGDQVIYAHQSFAFASPGLLSGVLAVVGQSGYRNGVLEAEGIAADSVGYSTKQGIGYWEKGDDGFDYGFWKGNIQALYYYDAILTPTQVRAVTDAMNMLPMRPQTSRIRSWLATKRQVPGVNKGPFIKS